MNEKKTYFIEKYYSLLKNAKIVGRLTPDIKELNNFEFELILEIMQEKKINKKELADITNIPQRTIYYILKNADNYGKTSFENASKIRSALNYDEERNKIASECFQKQEQPDTNGDNKKYIISAFNDQEKIDFSFDKEMFDKAIYILRTLSNDD